MAKTPIQREIQLSANTLWALQRRAELPTDYYDYDQMFNDVESVREAMEMVRNYLVMIAREHGQTWDDIGHMLGVSRQAAWERYSK